MRNVVIEVQSTLTDRYQTTVPETVRKALHLGKRDKIHYIIQSNGSVLITRVEDEQNDLVIEAFLSFLAKNIQKTPQIVMPLNRELSQRIQSVISGVEFDLNEPLSDEDESLSKLEGLVVNGWSIFAHPVFLGQLASLLEDVKRLCQKDLSTYKKKE